MKCQDETLSTLVCRCNYISLYVYKTQKASKTLKLETWSRCRLRCSSSRLSVLPQSNVSDSQHQKPKRFIITTFFGDHSKGTAFANNRAQVFRSHTCVTTLKPFLRVPLSSATTVFSERLSHCTGPPDQILTSSHELPSLGIQVCPGLLRQLAQGLEIVGAAAPCCPFSSCPSSFSPFAKFSFRSNTRTGNDFVPKSARISADVHAPTVTTPRFNNCCSQTTSVDN